MKFVVCFSNIGVSRTFSKIQKKAFINWNEFNMQYSFNTTLSTFPLSMFSAVPVEINKHLVFKTELLPVLVFNFAF